MNCRLRYHPSVAADLTNITEMIADYAGPNIAKRKLSEIAAAAQGLIDLPHRGNRRDHIVPGLRAIPAARRAVIVFTVDDGEREVYVLAITYGGADWISLAKCRH